jgi:hypothetical protein
MITSAKIKLKRADGHYSNFVISASRVDHEAVRLEFLFIIHG